MYTGVAFRYGGENIYSLFVAVYPTIFSDPYYIIMGMSLENSVPIAIGELGCFKNAKSALERVNEISKKYPQIYDSEIPEFSLN